MEALSKKTHFLGIGGIGMSALAHLLIEKGQAVSGSDQTFSPIIQSLVSKGLIFTHASDPAAQLIYSSAIPKDHPELLEAKKLGRLCLHRSELLAALMKKKKALLVAGTHGKTSTSALLSWVLLSSNFLPSYAVGGILKNTNQNGGYGAGDFFIAEADESDGSFLNYHGEAAILTNLEKEHLDYWKTEEKLLQGFRIFAKQNKQLFWCGDDPLLAQLNLPGTRYGTSKKNDLCLRDFKQKRSYLLFHAETKSQIFRNIELPLIGKHQALNALAVWGLCVSLGISELSIRNAFSSFQGVKRRLDKKGEVRKITIFDDYAHHPTEIKMLLTSLRQAVKSQRIIAIFEPHRYSRTRDFLSSFAKAFESADTVYVLPIYAAGEKPISGVSSEVLAAQIPHGCFIHQTDLFSKLGQKVQPGDIVLTIGAGKVTDLGFQIVEALQ